jgi:hypothetical protein
VVDLIGDLPQLVVMLGDATRFDYVERHGVALPTRGGVAADVVVEMVGSDGS